ncbi:glycosyltransferase family 2 protein [Nocardioides sp. BSK12Z-4]|uniref:Glycosyltransferase family 2 protein n=2 Tax=Nocardioides bruguierae TaxID=2945102 RepID=A0A9X2DA17_9ACTN|nr:glycosyltransferase family 2 protein [Nocardioides bruguierae]
MNRPEDLRRALASLMPQSLATVSIMVSNDGLDEPVRTICKEFSVDLVDGPRRGLGPNRNNCVSHAQTPLITFIDDDVIAGPDFIRAALQVDRTKVTTGFELRHEGTGQPKVVTPHNASFLGFQIKPPQSRVQAVVMNAAVFPTSALRAFPFDENITYGYEEIDISRKLASNGIQIAVDYSLWNNHHPSPINRKEYATRLVASRIYTTYRAYRCYEANSTKATAFLLTAMVHHVLHLIRIKGDLRSAFRTAVQVRKMWRESQRDQGGRTPSR